MTGELVFFAAAVGVFWILLTRLEATGGTLAKRTVSPQLSRALAYADRLYREKKYLTAEKAYLEVLKLDHKNLLAYNRLGIIYSAQHNYGDAIECFEIAVRLVPSAVTYLNLGLAQYENHNYIKAIATINKSIMFEPSAQRYLALAKAYHKIADNKNTIETLEKAAELEPTRQILLLLRDSYRTAGKRELAAGVAARLKALTSA